MLEERTAGILFTFSQGVFAEKAQRGVAAKNRVPRTGIPSRLLGTMRQRCMREQVFDGGLGKRFGVLELI